MLSLLSLAAVVLSSAVADVLGCPRLLLNLFSAKNSRSVRHDVELNRGVRTLQRPGTASLSRRVSEKCLSHKECLHDFIACFALQGMPSLSAHICALRKNETRKYRNENGICMFSVQFYIFTAM